MLLRPSLQGGQGKGQSFFKAARLASVGIEMGVAVGLGWAIGSWLDRKLGSKPWLMLVFLLFGVAAGFKGVLVAARAASRAGDDKGDGGT